MNHLSGHASTNGGIDNISDAINDLSGIIESRDEDGEDVADTTQHHAAIAESYHTVVAGVRNEVVLIHHSDSTSAQSQAGATKRLTKHTTLGAALFAEGTSLDAAAHGKLALETLVLRHISI